MLILASTAQPDYVALAMVVALLLFVAVLTVRKYIRSKRPALVAEAPVPAAEEPKAEPVTAPGSAGQVKLHTVEPKTAAMLMAIVADKLGKPLNELRFISIREVEKQ